ncbi:MAG: TonB-dependent receptor [Colwellia sp.]|nr:TonB-dependent receptor [Colwellia sp.]MCW8865039.1 TonB-dependent receptor [Colwellia sp.]MCW9080469.1 TonB-dependent receptor [Colwellia sp.]
MKTYSQKSCLASAITFALLSSQYAIAEEQATKENDLKLEVIQVTAQKRSQSLKEVPISVSAVSGADIENGQISDLTDLVEFVPGVHISKGPTNTSVNIRGIGSGFNRSFEQSVGMYIDDIYMGRARQFRAPFLDIERVEILRGPQGLLFGKNTIAGAINIVTKSPDVDEDLNGFINLRYEPKYGTSDISGAATIPLSDELAVRVAGKVSSSDGFIVNQMDGVNSALDDKLVRATFVWEPTASLSANLKLSHSTFEIEGAALTPRVFKIIDDRYTIKTKLFLETLKGIIGDKIPVWETRIPGFEHMYGYKK